MTFPFEVAPSEVLAAPESFVDAVFSSLASEFLVYQKAKGFLIIPHLPQVMNYSRKHQMGLRGLNTP